MQRSPMDGAADSSLAQAGDELIAVNRQAIKPQADWIQMPRVDSVRGYRLQFQFTHAVQFVLIPHCERLAFGSHRFGPFELLDSDAAAMSVMLYLYPAARMR